MVTPIPFERTLYAPLKHAVAALAGVCDGAETHDEQGFAGSDTKAGHLLAFLPLTAWPLSAFHRAWSWSRKYHRQWEGLQFDCLALPEPPLFAGKDRQIALDPGSMRFLVIFPYDQSLIAAFRRIPGNALHTQPIGQGKQVFRYRTVRFVPGASAALLVFAEQYDFQLASGVVVAVLAQGCNDTTFQVQDDYRIVCDPSGAQAFALYFPRNSMLNQEVKAIPGKSPCYDGAFHWVIPALPAALLALRAFVERHQEFSLSAEVQARLRGVTWGDEEERNAP